MFAKEIVARPHRHPHEPVLKGRFTTEARQLLKRLGPDLLNDVLNLALTAGVAAGRRENARRVTSHERLEARGIPVAHCGDQLVIRSLDAGGFSHSQLRPKRKATAPSQWLSSVSSSQITSPAPP